MTTEFEDKAAFDHECDVIAEEAERRERLEAKAVKMLAALGLTPAPLMTATRQVVQHLQADLLAHFKREGVLLQLQAGDLVRLKSGGPVMVVQGVEECEVHGQTCQSGCRPPAVVHCAWIVDRDNPGRFAEQVQSHSFTAEALVKVGSKDSGSTAKDVCVSVDRSLFVDMNGTGSATDIGKTSDIVDYLQAHGYEFPVSGESSSTTRGTTTTYGRNRQRANAARTRRVQGELTSCLNDLPSDIAEQLRQRPVTVTRFADGVKTTVTAPATTVTGTGEAEHVFERYTEDETLFGKAVVRVTRARGFLMRSIAPPPSPEWSQELKRHYAQCVEAALTGVHETAISELHLGNVLVELVSVEPRYALDVASCEGWRIAGSRALVKACQAAGVKPAGDIRA